jgi:hypothetical protein
MASDSRKVASMVGSSGRQQRITASSVPIPESFSALSAFPRTMRKTRTLSQAHPLRKFRMLTISRSDSPEEGG